MRSVYGRIFFQISAYSSKESRFNFLSRRFQSEKIEDFNSKAQRLIDKDENERDDHGQKVGTIFHDADLIVDMDSTKDNVESQVFRFCELIFSSNAYSPTPMEYGMFAAKSAALRSMDLARQVGAALFCKSGEIISVGCNDVPQGGGGIYSDGGDNDARDYLWGYDSNDKKKLEIAREIVRSLMPDSDIETGVGLLRKTTFYNALEYSRCVHAEMNAISDAARSGISTKEATLFCTTFPCHLCAKHIVSCGITDVIFLEPYPKSLAPTLHNDSIEVERQNRGPYYDYPFVRFSHFFGVTPRRYRELFERVDRKQDGDFLPYIDGVRQPLIDIKSPFYAQLEDTVLRNVQERLTEP